MSAQDNLGPQWYHASPEEFKEGDNIAPGDAIGKKHMGSGSDSAHVWVSDDPYRASSYGINIYTVTPHSTPVSPHKNDEYKTTGATVNGKIDYQDAVKISPAYQKMSKAYSRQRKRENS